MMAYQLSIAQKLDRAKRPVAGPAPKISIADPVIFELKNGIKVLVVENHKFPTVSVTYHLDVGPISESPKVGVVNLLNFMLNEGTAVHSKAQFDERIEQLGGEVGVSATNGGASAITKYFQELFFLMAEALRKPAFSQAAFDKLKSQRLSNLNSNEKNAVTVSSRLVGALSFGPTHPYGEFATPQSVTAITLEDVREAYRKIVSPSRGYLIFKGDITPEMARNLAEKAFGDWKGEVASLPLVSKAENPKVLEVNVINLPNTVQAEITLAKLVELPMSSPDYHAVQIANQILGGGANGKLYRNLRERRGFTYGAYSKAGAGRYQSTFSASASVRNSKADSALVELIKEINLMRTEKQDPQVVKDAKNLFNGNFALSLENPGIGAGFAATIMINDLPKDFYRDYLQKLNEVTPEDVLRVSKKYFNTENARVIIVGKVADFLPGLIAAGFKVKHFDIYAKPLTSE